MISDRGVVTARAVIVAAHVPIVNRVLLHAKLAAYRSYAVGVDLGRRTGSATGCTGTWRDPYHYIRTQRSASASC